MNSDTPQPSPTPAEKLGLMIAAAPENSNFRRGIEAAQSARAQGQAVYLYLIYDAVDGLDRDDVRTLAAQGVHLYACAFATQRRSLPPADFWIPAGLSSLHDLIADTDRFASFT